MQSKIDLVIMWVDGADEHFVKVHDDAAAKLEAEGIQISRASGQHRDSGELFFLLRSICQNMPWFRKIHIVTNGQIPKYVNFDDDRINLVTHMDIFPNPEDAPSFNTFAIESAANRIEGLSENYIRFSDDFFVARPVDKSFFFGRHGNGSYHFHEEIFSMFDKYKRTLQFNAVEFWKMTGFMPMYNYPHAPQLRNKSLMREMYLKWGDWLQSTRANKFRSDKDLVSLFLYPYFALYKAYGLEMIHHVRRIRKADSEVPVYRQILVGDSVIDWRKDVEALVENPPIMFNINDHFPNEGDPDGMRYLGQNLARLFPEPSLFEKSDGPLPELAQAAFPGK